MCLLCIELAKESMNPTEFWKNYKELVLTDDKDHWTEVIENVKKTSPKYQKKLVDFWNE